MQFRRSSSPQSQPRALKRPAEITGWVPKREFSTPTPSEPHLPHAYDDEDMRAWQALSRGEATPDQQLRLVKHLFFLTGHNGRGYVAGDPYGTAYAAGRRAIGVELGVILSLRPSKASDQEQGQ